MCLRVHSLPLPLVIDHLCFSWVHGLSEPSLYFPVSLHVIWPMECGEYNLQISLGAVQEIEFTLSVLSEMGLNKEVGAYKVIGRVGRREAVG